MATSGGLANQPFALSFGLAYLLHGLGQHFEAMPTKLSWLGYLSVFAITLLCNLTVIVPVPAATAVMVAGAARMPLRSFLMALWTGKFLKYIIVSYCGIGLIHFLPF